MKKTISLIMVLALCLSLSACVQNKAVGEAEALITAIGPVTLDSEEAIAAAERAYEALSAEDKAAVCNYGNLQLAKEEFLFLRSGALLEAGEYEYRIMM